MNSVLLLTGSSGGLGTAIADHLLSTGVRQIACHYRSSSSDISAVLAKHDLSPQRHLFQADLTDEKSVARLRREIEQRLGVVCQLINLAGASSNALSWKMSLSQFREVLDANLTTTFLTCREFIPSMRQLEAGRIINTSSIVAYRGAAGATHYAAAKAAIVGFSKSLSRELAPKKITVNTLALGYFSVGIIDQVPEPMRNELIRDTPAGRLGDPFEAARCIEYLLGPLADFVTGQTLHVNGGLY